MPTPANAASARAPEVDVGLVLSGGGSRGVAHIGVIRALLDAGIRPGCVAGTSAGAIVGAFYCADLPPEDMLDFFRTTDPFRIANIAMHKPGIWDSTRYAEDLRRYLPEDSFESLKRPLSVVATDLLAGEPTVFASGPLILPVLASASVPMVFSPTEIGGRWYGDGGIVDNFPVRLIRERCRVVIGVHVNPLREISVLELGTSLAVLERSMEVGMFHKSRERFGLCDHVILPRELAHFGMFDTKHFTEIEAAGYREARVRMPELLEAMQRAGLPLPVIPRRGRRVSLDPR